MRDSKNIDRLFQENLKDYEVFPPNKSWNAIKRNLSGAPKKKSVTSLWVRLSSIAALLVLFFTVGTIYFMPENNFTKNFVAKKNNSQKSIENNTTTNKEVVTSTTKGSKENLKSGKVIPLKVNNPQNNVVESEVIADISEDNTSTTNENSTSNFLLADAKNLPLGSNTSTEKVKSKDVENKFTVATIFAPIYFSSFGDGSGVDAQFNNNQTSGGTSYAYGVKFAYKLNKRLSVQSGVNMINLGQKTNDVYITPGVAVVGIDNISSAPSIAKNNTATLGKQSPELEAENAASLNQVFGYVEIPVEIKYNVASGKVGVNLVGGFSTLLLNRDEVYLQSNTFSQSLGNSNNLRSVNFSGNVGLDVDYSIYKNLYINVSPMFKVQTNTFSKTSGAIQSYYLGVYTGLNYKF